MNDREPWPAAIDLKRLDTALSTIMRGLSQLQDLVQETLNRPKSLASNRLKGVAEAIAALQAQGSTAVAGFHTQHPGQFQLFYKEQQLDPQESSTAELFDLLAAAPISLLKTGKRAQEMFQGLAVQTLLDLVIKTSAGILEAKNFGITSLNEVREQLQRFGLKLAGE